MPVEREKLPELIDQGAANIEGRLPGMLARVRSSVIGVLNKVVQGGFDALYKYIDRKSRSWWPDICDEEDLPDHGARWGKPRLSAAPATGTVQFAGLDGAIVPQGSVVQRSDGTQYFTKAPGVIAGGTANVAVEAVLPAQLGNAAIASSLTLTSPVPNVNAVATAFTALSGGANIEPVERWRARIMLRIRKPPQGGADFDYEGWALEVPGVTRAWVYRKEQGPGTVVVRFVRDDDADIIPDAGAVATVLAHIEAQCSVIADLFVVAPIATPQSYTIQAVPNTDAVKGAISSELAALYRREAKPGGTMLISQEREAVSISAGETDHVMTVPSANQTHATGQLPMLGVITWL